MTTATDNLTAAVSENTTATNAAVAALGVTGAPDESAVIAATAAIEANTKALNDAVTPPSV